MVELKCRAELAVTGRSACRNPLCENSKERGGRIPQGKLRWGIGGPGGHSMRWYCVRPFCLPADEVKDMLVPEKSGSAPEMDGVSELPEGFREATITCLEFINEDKADQLDAATLAKLDEVGPMIPIQPRAPVRDTTPSPSIIGRQGLRRARRSMGASSAGVSSSGGGGDEDDDNDSGDNHVGAMARGGSMGGGSSSSYTSIPTRTPPALLIPRRTSSGQGGDSPLLPPPEKFPKLDDDAIGEDEGSAAEAGASPSAGDLFSLSGASPDPIHEMYHAPPAVAPESLGFFAGSSPLGSMGHAAAAAGGGQGATGSPLLFGGAVPDFGHKGPAHDSTGGMGVSGATGLRMSSSGSEVTVPPAATATGASEVAGATAGAAPLDLSGLEGFSASAASAALPVHEGGGASGGLGGLLGGLGSSVGSGLGGATVGSSTDAIPCSLLGGDGTEADDPVASALRGIGDEVDFMGGRDDPYGGGSGGLLSGGAEEAAGGDSAEASSHLHTAQTSGDMLGLSSTAEHPAPATPAASAALTPRTMPEAPATTAAPTATPMTRGAVVDVFAPQITGEGGSAGLQAASLAGGDLSATSAQATRTMATGAGWAVDARQAESAEGLGEGSSTVPYGAPAALSPFSAGAAAPSVGATSGESNSPPLSQQEGSPPLPQQEGSSSAGTHST